MLADCKVEGIRNERLLRDKANHNWFKEYLIKWVDMPESKNTWVKEHSLNCDRTMIEKFLKQKEQNSIAKHKLSQLLKKANLAKNNLDSIGLDGSSVDELPNKEFHSAEFIQTSSSHVCIKYKTKDSNLLLRSLLPLREIPHWLLNPIFQQIIQ